jgi:hypothetical protein
LQLKAVDLVAVLNTKAGEVVAIFQCCISSIVRYQRPGLSNYGNQSGQEMFARGPSFPIQMAMALGCNFNIFFPMQTVGMSLLNPMISLFPSTMLLGTW